MGMTEFHGIGRREAICRDVHFCNGNGGVYKQFIAVFKPWKKAKEEDRKNLLIEFLKKNLKVLINSIRNRDGATIFVMSEMLALIYAKISNMMTYSWIFQHHPRTSFNNSFTQT
ncbi:unnamed protein product [Prunus armeniaca]